MADNTQSKDGGAGGTADTVELVVPALGESITEAVIGSWLVEVGQSVQADDPVVDLETDKITVQLPAPVAGVLAERSAETGDTVVVGDVVGVLRRGGAESAKSEGGKKADESKTDESKAGEDKAGEDKAGEDKADENRARENKADEDKADENKARENKADANKAVDDNKAEPGSDLDEDALRKLTPAQRRAVRMGTAPPPTSTSAPASPAKPAPRAAPAAPADSEDERVVVMSPLRKRIAERLVQAQDETASLTTFNEVDMSAVIALRKRLQDEFVAAHGIKLGFMSLFAKACVAACRKFPGLHAEVRVDAIVYKQRFDFGIAVSTDRGLVVPVLRGVDALGLADIERGIADLAGKAREGKLTMDDLVGGTFTITNGGIFGSMLSTPLLNFPQTGILGMHNIVRRPVAVGDEVEIRPIMYLALTYDHRVVDGREAVQFLVAVKQRIEQPERLMLEV